MTEELSLYLFVRRFSQMRQADSSDSKIDWAHFRPTEQKARSACWSQLLG